MIDRRLFVDLDGTLADFDGRYEQLFGLRPNRAEPEPPDLWSNIGGVPNFFATLDPLPDAFELWEGVKAFRPVILTGVPDSVPAAAAQKIAWVRVHLGTDVLVICCRSRDKALHGNPGDILVDDWDKYQARWERMGGIFVWHTRAATSVLAVTTAWFLTR